MRFWMIFAFFIGIAAALRCYDGTVDLGSNIRTKEKDCPTSNYCVQKINRNTNKTIRECSSWSDEHSMEEKCPMSGCHWQSKQETYCCCQFDLCNEYKADGSQFHESEMRKADDFVAPTLSPSSRVSINQEKPTGDKNKNIGWKVTPTTRNNGEINLD